MDGVLTTHITVALCIRTLLISRTKTVFMAIQETKEGFLTTVIIEDQIETQGVHLVKELLLRLVMQ